MSMTKKLRLGPLPKTESIKLTFACPTGLKAELDRYAALHAQTPHMLEAFMAADRGFKRGRGDDKQPSFRAAAPKG